MHDQLRFLARNSGIQFDHNNAPVVDRNENLEEFARQILKDVSQGMRPTEQEKWIESAAKRLGLQTPEFHPYRSPTDIALGIK